MCDKHCLLLSTVKKKPQKQAHYSGGIRNPQPPAFYSTHPCIILSIYLWTGLLQGIYLHFYALQTKHRTESSGSYRRQIESCSDKEHSSLETGHLPGPVDQSDVEYSADQTERSLIWRIQGQSSWGSRPWFLRRHLWFLSSRSVLPRSTHIPLPRPPVYQYTQRRPSGSHTHYYSQTQSQQHRFRAPSVTSAHPEVVRLCRCYSSGGPLSVLKQKNQITFPSIFLWVSSASAGIQMHCCKRNPKKNRRECNLVFLFQNW